MGPRVNIFSSFIEIIWEHYMFELLIIHSVFNMPKKLKDRQIHNIRALYFPFQQNLIYIFVGIYSSSMFIGLTFF